MLLKCTMGFEMLYLPTYTFSIKNTVEMVQAV